MGRLARFTIVVGLLLLVVSGVFAQEAIIRELLGTVELKPAGSAVWERAVQGQSVAVDTVVSTGFKSNALIGIGTSIINVRPLTRLSIRELSTSQGIETINVGLQAGRARFDVNPPAGNRTAFTVQTPPATASVRGTIFEVGLFELWVIEGSIEYRGSSGGPVIVDAVGYSYVDERTGRAVLTKWMLLDSLSPAQPIAFDSFSSFSGSAAQQRSGIEVSGEMEFD